MAGLLSDELSKQMDADLFGEPRKSPLDPKISGEMDKELGLAPSRPWTGAIKTPEPEEPGYLGALGKGIYTGFRRRLPEMTGQAIQFTGAAPETGKAITEWAREGEKRPEFKSGIKQALYEGGEMLAPSVAVPAALGVAGVGVLPASIATAALFGLSQAQQTKETAEKAGVEAGAAPYATGAIEAIGETAGTAALSRLLGPLAPILTKGGKVAVKDVIKPTVSRLLKEFPRTMAIEGGTEFGQQFGEAMVEKGAGIRPEAEPLQEGIGVLGPTAVLTGLTMGMAVPSQRLRARSVEKSLEDEKSPEGARRSAADYVASFMAEADEDFAKRWKTRADQAISQGQRIPVDEDIYEWLGEGPKGAIPEERKEEQKEAIPSQPAGYDLIEKKPVEEEASGIEVGDLQPGETIPGEKEKSKEIRGIRTAPSEEVGDLQPEFGISEQAEAKDLLKALQRLPGSKKQQPSTPEVPAYTEEQLQAALAGMERPKEAIKAEAPKGAIPAADEGKREKKEAAAPAAEVPETPKEEEGKDTISYTIKKDFEEQNRKTIEGLSYIGALSKREEQANDWIKLTYKKKQAIPTPEKIEEAAAEAATSPTNAIPEPTEAQKEAGNYQKGHVNLHGLDISIENPRGSTRSGVSPEGKKWETPLAHHYGYIRGTKGKDKDHLDVFIGPHPESEFVTVIDQVDPKTGKFDEHKVMMGFLDTASAQVGYLSNYEPGWKGLGAAKGLDILEFKKWVKEGDTTKPIALKGAIPEGERRKDLEKRKRISEMSAEEMKKELLTDPLTGLGNRRAYEESLRMPVQVMIDVDSLKAVNDTMGHEAGDDLLRAVGRSLQGLLVTRAYHTSGDEFIVEGPDRETVERQLLGVRETLAQAEIEATAPDGTKYHYKGLEISYGIGTNLKEADDALSRSKQEREKSGLRAPRGERPKGLAAIPAEGVEAHGEAPGREVEEPKSLPANWLDAGWKIRDQGALQIATSPEGKEYTLWGQRLQPVAESPKAKEEATTYKGISISKPARELTDEEFEKIIAPAGESMEKRNEELARYLEDSRFFVPLKPGEIGYQPSLPADRQPLHIDWHAVRSFINTGELPPQGKKIQKIADRLMEMSPLFSKVGSVKTAYQILMAIERGYYNDALHPSNINSRKVFAELTGQKLPPGVSRTREFVQGKTFQADFSKIEKEAAPKIEEILSPDLEYKRFVDGLSAEEKQKASGFIVPNPRNPLAQIRAIKKELEKPEEKEPEAAPAEEEVTPQAIPFEAVKYANAIKNKLKKNYAWAYLKWKTGKIEEKPEPKGLSGMAAQIVRMSIDKLLGEPYKFKPIAEEAKAEGGKAHETRRSEGAGEGRLVGRPPGVAAGEQPTAGEEPLRERPGEAGRAPEPGAEEGHEGVYDLEASGQGGRERGVRAGRKPAAPGEPARAPAGGARREDQGLGGELRPRRPNRVEDRNHVIAPDDTLVPGGKISRIKANVGAIELAKSLEKEKRNPTPEEKKTLAQFTGWGALGKEAFEPEEWISEDPEKNGILKSRYAWHQYSEEEKKEYKAWFDRIGKKLHPDLGGILTQEEWDEAKSSILNAFYTSREVIENGLWPIIQRLGFKGGTILEPAGGVGHILGLMPQEIAESSRIQAIEKDRLSGLILSKLYPEAKVFVKGFEQSREIRDNSVDLVVSNFPFGDIRIFDAKHKDYSGFSIHNYFFARSIDALKPGGILVAITSHYTLDSAGTEHRKYLASKADFVGGLRLPGTAFEKTAGTEVTTDILIFRKKDSSNFKGESFIDTRPEELAEKDDKGNPKTAYINEYFAAHPEMVLGKHSLQGTMYAKDTYALLPLPGKDLKTLLPEKVDNLPKNIAGESSIEVEPAPVFADEGTKEGLIVEKEGKIYINENGRLNPIFGVQKVEPVKRYVAVRTALKDLITMEIGEGTETAIEAQRKKLNRLYDGFVAKHGFISGKDNKWLRADAEFSLMSSLEAEDKEKSKQSPNKVFKKAAILSQRTNFPFREPDTAATEEDAIKISLTYRNKIDLPYVAKLLGAENDAVRESVIKKRIAFLNPATGNLESPDEYLSGNVREKLEKAREAAKDDPTFDINVEELTKIQPADLAINQIYYRLGSPWIPTEAIQDFMGDLLNFKDVEVKYLETAETSKFIVAVKDTASYRLRDNAAIMNVWGVEGANALSLIEDSLNLKFTAIYDSVWDPDQKKEKPVFNPQKSQAAREMQRKLNDEFVKWTRKHEKWAGELAGVYNRDFNNTVLKEFPVPEMEYYPNASHAIRLRKHQRRAVSRNLQESCIDAHAVGTGKTYIFATTAMEMRRLGTAKKPMIVVQNSTVHQYAKAFRELYPTANILIPNKKQLSKENRKRLISQIVTGNWDAIIVPHSAFDMISVTPAKEAAYIREQVGDLERIIGEMRAEDEDKRSIRQIEKLKESKEQKLLKLLSGKREDVIYFDEIGVDALLVDEAHRYKRGEFYTKMTKIKGIDRQSASRSMLMLLKAQEVSKRTGGKNVVMATGTPLSNTLAEIWTMLRYVRPDLLERFNARQFDSFAANFGQVVQETEETPSGDFKVIERFAKYVNGPEILSMWRSAADIVLPEDVDVERPKIRTGKPIDLQLNRSQELANFIKWIKAEREAWDRLPGKEKMQSSHVPLVLFGLAKKAAIDLRLVSPKMPDLPGSKVNRAVEEVFTRWKENEKTRATQVIFSDTFQSTDKSFNLFKDIRKKLIEKGIPANEIAIIHAFNSDDKRDELFGKVTDGDIRVIMGTTEKLGVGVNIQDRLIAAHHIDVPQRPMDFEQRNGRIWRPGNLNDEIDILVYGVKNTLDSTGFQRLLIKQKFINQIMRGDISDRSFDDPFDPTQATFQDMMSAFGNPKVREKFGLENQIRDLNSLKESHENEIARARRTIDQNKFKLRNLRESLKNWDEISKILSDAFPENKVTDFAFTVKGKMSRMDKDHFLQAVQDEIDEIEKRAKEIIGKGEFDISRDYFNAEKEVRGLSSGYANFHAQLNGVPVTISFFPSTTGGMKGDVHLLSFEGVGIEYRLRPKEYKDFNYYLERKVSTPGGILISMQSLVPYGIAQPREIRSEITKTENNIKNLQPLLDQPFDREAEIREKKGKLAEVEKELMAAESETEEQAAQRKEKEKAELDSLRHEYGEVGDKLYAEKKKVEETPAEEETEGKPGDENEEGEISFSLERTSWQKETSRVVQHSTIEKMKNHPDYAAAKAGDDLAGRKVARAMMKAQKIAALQKSLADEKRVIIVPVRMFENGERNTIPLGMANVISKQTGWEIDESIYQTNDVAHTKKSALKRLLAQAEFEGDVVPGATYVILDDVVTTGGTLANLKGFIESKGGRVKAIQTIGAAQFATNLRVMPATLKKLREAYGQNLKEALEYVYGGSIHEENLTESEARTLIHKQREILDRARAEKAEGRLDQGLSLDERRRPKRIRAEEVTPPAEELSGIAGLVEKIANSKVVFQDTVPIDLRDPKNQAALKKHGWTDEEIALYISEGYTAHNVAGRMTPVLVSPDQWKAIINIAVQGKDALQVKSTALHEAFEAARNFMLTDEEIKVLDARYPGKEGLSASEVQADAFADFVLKKKAIPLSIRGILGKIQAFFDRLGNFLRGLGFKNAEDIFEAAAEGRIRERYEAGATEAASEAAFKLEPVEQAEVKETLSHPEASVMEAVREKQHLKSLIRAEIEGGEIPEGAAVRFADAGYIKSLLRQGTLPEGASFEGRAGISATRVRRGITPVAYGSNYKHSAAIAIPEEYIRGTGNAPNEVLIDPKTPLDRLRFYIDGQERSFRIDELRQLGALREERIPAFKLDGPIRKIIDSLKSPELPAEAEQDKGFKNSIKKTRLGLVKVTDNDLKLWERALSLPFWLQDKYRELRPLVHTQMKREENRSETIHGLLNRARPFFALKGDEMGRVEKALVQGDREGKVYEENELREKFNLGAEGINGYRAVRKTLDWIHAEWKARIEENILREYKKEKWFALFKAAHGLEFSDEETLALDKALKKTRKAMEKPVETVRAHLQHVFEEEFSPRNKKLLAELLGDYMRAYRRARKQIDKIKEIVRDAIGEGMSEEDLNKNTQYLVQAYIRSLPAMQQLKELRSQLNRIKGYFPRSRKQGKYRVVVTDSFEDAFGEKQRQTVYYENAANRLEATKIYDKIKADLEYKDMEIAVEPVRQEAETTFMGASAINMQRLVDNAIDKLRAQGDLPGEIASMIRMNVLETLVDELKARGAGRFAIRRAENIIEGYQKTNLKEVLKDYIDGWSGMITKQEAALEFLDELKQIPRGKPQLMAYGSKYAQDMLRNQEPMDRISAKMRSLAFLYFLGGSLRAAAVNFTQNYVTGIPFLAREVGARSLKAEKIYHKAMFDVAVGKNLSQTEMRMLDEMINKGVAEDQFIRQINREVKGALGQWTGKVVDILSKPFSWMEKLNRKSAALSMFRVKMEQSKAKGMNAEEAYRKAFDEAQDFVYKTHYLMTKANLPSMAAGGEIGAQFLKTAYTFRRFTHNYLLSLHHSLKGPEGGLALDVMARSLAYVVLLAGIPAIPFLDDLLDEWEKFFGIPVRSNMRKTLREAGGPFLEKMGMAGIPALMGIDISGSLKTGIPLVGAGTPQDTIYGVYGGLARKNLNAMSAVEREDYLRALEFASPAFIEAILKAYRMSDVGLTTPRGKIITDEQGKPIRLGAGEGVAQAAGFRPEGVARVSGEHWTMENVQKHFKEKRDDLYSRYRLARTPEEKQKVIRDMQRFNLDARKYRGVIPPITATSLRQAALQKPEKAFLSFGRMHEKTL